MHFDFCEKSRFTGKIKILLFRKNLHVDFWAKIKILIFAKNQDAHLVFCRKIKMPILIFCREIKMRILIFSCCNVDFLQKSRS